MATIKSNLAVSDGMTPALRRINKAMSLMVTNFERAQRTANRGVDTSWCADVRREIGLANAALDDIERQYEQCARQQERFNRTIDDGATKADNLLGKIKGMAGAYIGMQGISNLAGLSDTQAQTTARLNLLVEDGGSVAELEKKIRASANRSRSAYLDTASAVAKMGLNAGNAFKSNDELIAFTELINKQFVIGGATAQEQSNAMVQLTQAMAAGALRGEELNSILDGAPGIARAIEQYMGAAEGSIKTLAADGLVTAEVVKNAMFATAEETNAKFESMPMTWSQVWTTAGNMALIFFNPLLQGINWLANNLAIIGPIVLGIGAAFAVFQVAAHWTKIASVATAAYHAVVNFLSIGLGMLRGSTAAASAAQFTYNSALMACPLTWIIGLILIIIGLFYGIIGIINKVTDSSISATGIIVGALASAGAFIWNLIYDCLEVVLTVINYLINPFIQIANFIGNVFTNPISSIIYLFQGMADNVLAVLQKIASAMDFVFGSNMADTVQGWRDGLKGKADALVAEYAPNENYQAIMGSLNLSAEGLGLKRIDYGDAWNAGYNAGEGIENTIGNMFSVDSITKGIDIPTAEQYANIGGSLEAIADDTSSLAGSTNKTTEELAYLRDMAEQEAINRFTTAEVKVDLGGVTNNVAANTDLDGMMAYIVEGFVDALSTAAEGVHDNGL